MTLTDRLQTVAVLGAGGKMGSGISLLLAQEMTLQKLIPDNSNRDFTLYLMDVNPAALEGLRHYLHTQGRKFVQKNAERLAHRNPLLAAADAADTFVETLDGIIRPVTELDAVAPAQMVFEAILEKMDLKLKVYTELRRLCSADTWFFSNTSSIPLKELNDGADLGGRLIGFHFYNPPAVQKLVELIIPETVMPALPEAARQLGERLGKIIIPSNDVAGFIGNGHFMRDGLHGIAEAERLAADMPLSSAIYIVNRISKDFLIRPMGIFQLIDYVGLDIFQSILAIMDPHFPDEVLRSDLIDRMVSGGVIANIQPSFVVTDARPRSAGRVLRRLIAPAAGASCSGTFACCAPMRWVNMARC